MQRFLALAKLAEPQTGVIYCWPVSPDLKHSCFVAGQFGWTLNKGVLHLARLAEPETGMVGFQAEKINIKRMFSTLVFCKIQTEIQKQIWL